MLILLTKLFDFDIFDGSIRRATKFHADEIYFVSLSLLDEIYGVSCVK